MLWPYDRLRLGVAVQVDVTLTRLNALSSLLIGRAQFRRYYVHKYEVAREQKSHGRVRMLPLAQDRPINAE